MKNINDYSWNLHEQQLKKDNKIAIPAKPKIKIEDIPNLRAELVVKLEYLNHKELAQWAMKNALPFLAYLDDKLKDDFRIQESLTVFNKRLNHQASAYELRQAGFLANQLAKESSSELSKSGARVFAQAIATGHMRGHGMISADYAVKVMNILAPNDLEKVRQLREQQLKSLRYLRKYQRTDKSEVMTLISNTIKTINCHDYNEEQIATWSQLDEDTWTKSLIGKNAFVMVAEQKIVGFGDMTSEGYLDRLYVHHDFQKQGIATQLVTYLEKETLAKKVTTFASITAKPFFERHGYQVIRENIANLRGIDFINYEMEKSLR